MKYAECIHVLSALLASTADSFQRTNKPAEKAGFDGAQDYWFRTCNMAVKGYRGANFTIRAAQIACETTAITAEWAIEKLKETEKDMVICGDVAAAMKVSNVDASIAPIANMVLCHLILSKGRKGNGGRENKIIVAASIENTMRCVAFFVEIENMVIVFQIMS